MEVRGKFNFPSQTFDFSDLTIGKQIKFNELNDCKDVDEKSVKDITITSGGGTPITFIIVITYYDETTSSTLTNINNINQDLDQLLFGGDIIGIGKISTNSTDSDIISQIQDTIDNTVNVIFLYKMNSPKNKLDKSLTWVATEYMKYTRQIEYKKMLIDVKRSASEESFNYVYLSVLNRFYFVDSIALTNDMMNVSLIEDVLSSFKDLIRSQTAFVTRNENTYDDDKVDDLVEYDFDKSVSVTTITPTNDIYNKTATDALGGGYFVLITV